ncbi:hypothetical protein PoB_007306100 [Plakobranchus ocellatus]|uniref:Uncharacterized protein n=1 Tax=Plakobranchus ocellatus TaxID=259542 RepID=A0AAV4DRP4_9GAST|nr:hypothetical protein PoB_007306100 [Plakobranchus ocellatus]
MLCDSTRMEGLVFYNVGTRKKGDLGLSGPQSGQGAGGEAQVRDRIVSANLRATESLVTVPPTPPFPGNTLGLFRKLFNRSLSPRAPIILCAVLFETFLVQADKFRASALVILATNWLWR